MLRIARKTAFRTTSRASFSSSSSKTSPDGKDAQKEQTGNESEPKVTKQASNTAIPEQLGKNFAGNKITARYQLPD